MVIKAVAASFVSTFLCITFPLASLAGDEVAQCFQKSFKSEQQGDISSSLNQVIRILQIENTNYTATLRAGWLYYLQGYHRDSAALYRKAIELRPGSIEARQGLTLPLIAMKQWKQAALISEDGLKLDGNNYILKARLAKSYYYLGNFKDAAAIYRQLSTLYPSKINLKLGLAWCHVKMGKLTAAQGLFKEVLSIRRENKSALEGLEATSSRMSALQSY